MSSLSSVSICSRKVKDFVKKLRYALGLIFLLENWPEVLWRFLTRSDGRGSFRFRSGLVMHYAQWIEVEEVIGTFIRRDYGEAAPGKIVVDVGASLGSFSLAAAQQGAAKVLAYEPAPESFKILSENIGFNRLQNRIRPFRLGVAGRSGKREFFLATFSPLSSLFGKGAKTDVDCVTLADIFKEHRLKKLDLLKLDCEGAEYEILYGAPPEILGRIKEIRLEYHMLPKKHANSDDLTEFLLRKGFGLVHQRKDAPISGILWFRRV